MICGLFFELAAALLPAPKGAFLPRPKHRKTRDNLPGHQSSGLFFVAQLVPSRRCTIRPLTDRTGTLSGPLLLLLQDHHQCGLLLHRVGRDRPRRRDGVWPHHQHPQEVQPLPRGIPISGNPPYVQVFVAALYRNFKHLEKMFGWKTQTCYQINRGNGVAPVESCEGAGNSHYFYINYAFLVACTVVGIIFLLGVLLRYSPM